MIVFLKKNFGILEIVSILAGTSRGVAIRIEKG